MSAQNLLEKDSTFVAKSSTGRGWWEVLADSLRQFQPSVVVLIARKAPRIAQAFQLEFGRSVLVISDLAIPFSGAELNGARVAIVDDVVNVGSTLLRAKEAVLKVGAAEVSLFVIADSASESRLEGLDDLVVADPTPLVRESREAMSAEIPGRLQCLGRPYDLDFPLLRCPMPADDEGFSRLRIVLSERYGAENVYDLSTPLGAEAGVRRLTVDLASPLSTPSKIRAYMNERTRECVLAPIRLQTPIPSDRPGDSWAQRIWAEVEAEDVEDEEAKGRLRVYLDSLAVGFRFVARNSDVFRCDIEHPLLAGEAELVFGPRITGAMRFLVGWPLMIDAAVDEGSSDQPIAASPFLKAARDQGLIGAVQERLEGTGDELSAFIEFFNTLAEWVGADNPDGFRLDWPFSLAEIQSEPYRRLRIGPTFADLVLIIEELSPQLATQEAWSIVSRLLDRFIDEGGVVPTTTTYDGALYRIYRKGEKDPRDRVSLRTRRAWYESHRALSLTRVSKLTAILAFSEDTDATDVGVATLERGNVSCYARTVLHDEAEISHRLLRTNQLERVSRAEN